MVRRGTRVCFLDVEASGLDADVGVTVGVGLMDLGGRFRWFYVSEPRREREILRNVFGNVSSYHILVTWNGERFDIPFLCSRALKLRINPEGLMKPVHLDLASFVRSCLKLSRMDLYHVARFLGIAKDVSVEGVDVPSLYQEALRGRRGAESRIRSHCKDDLETTRRVFLKVLPLIRFMKPELAL